MTPISSSLNSQEMSVLDTGTNDSSVLDLHQTVQDDLFDQMISTFPSWADLPNPSPFAATDSQKLFAPMSKPDSSAPADGGVPFTPTLDESTMLASWMQQHQISGGASSPTARSLGLPQRNTTNLGLNPSQILNPRTISRSPGGGEDLSFPLCLGQGGGNPDSSPDSRIRDENAGICQKTPTSVPNATGAAAPARPRVRARRGQATDPHSIAERLRRERIAERMKALQELVPNANRTDKSSTLDEIIDYVKFLQLQVKVLSMSRLGGAAAVAPLVANISAELGGTAGNLTVSPVSEQDDLTATEQQLVRLMEEDVGSAMHYLQGKGLCLMPISLASAISPVSCRYPPSVGAASNGASATVLQSTNIMLGLENLGGHKENAMR